MELARKTDEELMHAFQDGDFEAFRALFGRYEAPIFAFLVRQCGNRDTARDMAQDVFFRVVRSAGSFHHQSKFSTWVYTIARNAAVDASRKARHRNHPSLDDSRTPDAPCLFDRIATEDPGPDRGATSERLRADLSAAIDKLPADQREVFLLREYSGLRFDEIADVVGAKVGTVKSRMRYALEGLRGALADYEEYARSLP